MQAVCNGDNITLLVLDQVAIRQAAKSIDDLHAQVPTHACSSGRAEVPSAGAPVAVGRAILN